MLPLMNNQQENPDETGNTKPTSSEHRFFSFLARKISFGFGIAFFTVLGAWFAVIYGYFFIYGNIPFRPGELQAFTNHLLISVGIVSLLYFIQSGLLHPLGFPGIDRRFRAAGNRQRAHRLPKRCWRRAGRSASRVGYRWRGSRRRHRAWRGSRPGS